MWRFKITRPDTRYIYFYYVQRNSKCRGHCKIANESIPVDKGYSYFPVSAQALYNVSHASSRILQWTSSTFTQWRPHRGVKSGGPGHPLDLKLITPSCTAWLTAEGGPDRDVKYVHEHRANYNSVFALQRVRDSRTAVTFWTGRRLSNRCNARQTEVCYPLPGRGFNLRHRKGPA